MILKKDFPNPGGMEIGTPYQNLVGVILSARTRDEQVLKLLPGFFKAFKDPKALSVAGVEQIEKKINTIGMYLQKAKNLKSMAQDVVHKFHGKIPSNMEDLVSLAGVGRKTASVILVISFGEPAIAVDTHVHRVTNRLGWVNTDAPEKTEKALLTFIKDKEKPAINQVFVKFGRYVCIPGKPRCWMCPIKDYCSYSQKQENAPKDAEEIKLRLEEREKNLESLRLQAVK